MACFNTTKTTFKVLRIIFITEDELIKKAMKNLSKDQEVATTFFFSNEDKVRDAVNSNKELCKTVKALDFVSCFYDNYWWIGLVLEKYDQQEDLHIKFMYFHRPSPSSV